MSLSRRSLFGLIAGAAAIPTIGLPAAAAGRPLRRLITPEMLRVRIPNDYLRIGDTMSWGEGSATKRFVVTGVCSSDE